MDRDAAETANHYMVMWFVSFALSTTKFVKVIHLTILKLTTHAWKEIGFACCLDVVFRGLLDNPFPAILGNT